MADISKIKLPSGNTYEIKDAVARQAIAGGVSFIIAWDGESTPVVANIPAGVTVTYQGTQYTGTLAATAAQAGGFYLVKSSTQVEVLDRYDEYVAVTKASVKSWEKIGDTHIDLSIFGELAYKDNVTLVKGSGDNALGEATTFTNSPSAVSFQGGQTKDALGSGATFETNVSLTKSNVNVPVVSKNEQKSIPNVTDAGQASTWNFGLGSGSDAETLIISGANGEAPTLGTPIEATDTAFGTDAVATNVTGVSATTGVATEDKVTAVTSIGTGTAAAQEISVGTNDKVKVAKFDDLSVSVS